MDEIEIEARAMSKPQRVAYLREQGWYRLSYRGAQSWFAPGWRRVKEPVGIERRRIATIVVAPGHDRAFYSLAAAIRKALNDSKGNQR